MSEWQDYSKVYDEKDITTNTLLVELTSRGMGCAPVAFCFWFLVNDVEALPGFHEALAALVASDGDDEAIKDEVTQVLSLSDFLAEEKNQAELWEDFNWANEENPLPAGYKFKLPGDEALIADAISAHNQNQF